MATGFKRASGCKYPKCNVCGYDKILDANTCMGPSSQVVGGKACPYCDPPEGLEFNISLKLSPRSIILCLLTLGVVIKCIELSFNI